jgi:hypothetical protein
MSHSSSAGSFPPPAHVLDELRAGGDPQADKLVAHVCDGDALRTSALLEELLRYRPGDELPSSLPAPIAEFMHREPTLPAWADPVRIERAQRRFGELELEVFFVLGFASLPACYSVPSIAEVLIGSGRLAAQVFRRINETADFTTAILTPGGLEAGAPGRLWCLKLRLVHAAMRSLARAQPSLEGPTGQELQDFLLRTDFTRRDQTPISPVELAYVLQTFAHLVVHTLPKLGVELSAQERTDYLHLWSVVGAWIGIDERLLPQRTETLELDTREFYHRIAAANRRSSDSGRLLAATLMVVMTRAIWQAVPSLAALRRSQHGLVSRALRLLPVRLVQGLDRGLGELIVSMPRSWIRTLIGRGAAADLGIGRAPLLHAVGHRFALLVAVIAERADLVATLRALLGGQRIAVRRIATRFRRAPAFRLSAPTR